MSLAATVTMVLMLVLLASLVIVLSGMEAGLRFVESKVEVQAELNDGVLARPRRRPCRSQVEALPEVASRQLSSARRRRSPSSAQPTRRPRDEPT